MKRADRARHGRLFYRRSLHTVTSPLTLMIANEIATHLSGARNDKKEEAQNDSFHERCSGGVYLRLISGGDKPCLCRPDKLGNYTFKRR